MIGDHDDAPVRIFVGFIYYGDGHFLDGRNFSGVFATEDAAWGWERELGNRTGPRGIEEWQLTTDGRYEKVREVK